MLVIAFVLAFVLGRIRTDKARRIVSFVVAGIVLTLHAATQIWRVASFAAGRGDGIIDSVSYLVMPNEILPFQLCSMLCILIPIAVVWNKQWMYNALAPICIFAGFLFFFFPEHIKDNIDIFDFKLTDEEMAEIAKINKNKRVDNYNFNAIISLET